MSGSRVKIDVGATMIEMYSYVRITLRRFDHSGVERGAPDRVDVLVGIDIVGREDSAGSRACGMDRPAAHRDRVLQYFIRDAELFERVNPASGKRKIDRAPTDDIAFARIGPALVEIDVVPTPPQIRG